MVRAIRAVTVERGLDPRELTLLAFGGSGPVHACDLARTLGIARVRVPAGAWCVHGDGHAGRQRRASRVAVSAGKARSVWTRHWLRRSGRRCAHAATAAMVAQGYAAGTVSFTEQIDLRLEGQDASLSDPDLWCVRCRHRCGWRSSPLTVRPTAIRRPMLWRRWR